MAIEKTNVSAVGLHLVPGADDNILAYSDGIADTEYEPLDVTKEIGAHQNVINKELRDALYLEIDWHEE